MIVFILLWYKFLDLKTARESLVSLNIEFDKVAIELV